MNWKTYSMSLHLSRYLVQVPQNHAHKISTKNTYTDYEYHMYKMLMIVYWHLQKYLLLGSVTYPFTQTPSVYTEALQYNILKLNIIFGQNTQPD